MYKLNKNKGYSLIEVILSLAICTILLSSIFAIRMKLIKFQNHNLKVSKHIEVLKTLENKLVFNYDYGDLESQFNETLYINNGNLNLESIKNKSFSEILALEKNNKLPYLEINTYQMDEGVLKFHLKIVYNNSNSGNTLNAFFYKGDY